MTKVSKPQGLSSAALKRALSERRLDAYRLHPDEPLGVVVGRYRWNVALCASMYPALHLLEVTLRNAMHRGISELYQVTEWYDRSPPVLNPRGQDAIRAAKEELKKKGKPEDVDHLIAELSFGFWTGLLSREYEQALWPRLLIPTFPHMPRRDRHRRYLADRLHALRFLRNAVSHYDKICTRNDLPRLYDTILETIGWIEQVSSGLLPVGESFQDILARGSAAYEIEVDE